MRLHEIKNFGVEHLMPHAFRSKHSKLGQPIHEVTKIVTGVEAMKDRPYPFPPRESRVKQPVTVPTNVPYGLGNSGSYDAYCNWRFPKE